MRIFLRRPFAQTSRRSRCRHSSILFEGGYYRSTAIQRTRHIDLSPFLSSLLPPLLSSRGNTRRFRKFATVSFLLVGRDVAPQEEPPHHENEAARFRSGGENRRFICIRRASRFFPPPLRSRWIAAICYPFSYLPIPPYTLSPHPFFHGAINFSSPSPSFPLLLPGGGVGRVRG